MKYLLTILSLCTLTTLSNGQTSQRDSIIDELISEYKSEGQITKSVKNYHFLYTGIDFSNKTFSAGREIGIDQNNLTGQIFYFNTKGLILGVSGAWYSQLDPKYSTTVFSAGYGNKFKKLPSLTYRLSANYFLFHTGSYDYTPTYRGSINAGTTLKNNWAGTRLDFNLLAGKEFGTSISWDIYSKIKLLKLGKYDKIQLEPEVSFYFSSESVEVNNTGYFDELLFTDIQYTNAFGLLNTKFILPVNVSYKNFNFELGYQLNLPHSLDSNYTYEKNSAFNISIGYLFGL
jgi:hypothetical protein